MERPPRADAGVLLHKSRLLKYLRKNRKCSMRLNGLLRLWMSRS